jgi:UDP-N-acetylmuramate: L-alanyl-gamma-D-glutamyl-meso-diaminopimelate ligase
MELHTFSSLNEKFLAQYKDSMQGADVALVYFNPAVIAHKKLEPVERDQVEAAFGNPTPEVYTIREDLIKRLREESLEKSVLVLMSSGNFDGMDVVEFAKELHAASR